MKLTEQDKNTLVDVATAVNKGVLPMDVLRTKFLSSGEATSCILQFWAQHSDETRKVVDKVYLELSRDFLELCYFLSDDVEE